ncbi:phenylalanine 4-monooxygenase [Endozoicomonas ascidiicola]|uniref:phenylalanine 4-monooxygenase n=1 Tax=Endozoicomonas ascidiicola TaxID=1698521 RepID=UPI0008304FC5|nr:phenylalanine 4-monooxygenase [Endozoicomonas ascidiicola]
MEGTQYKARMPDNSGFIHYSDEENETWSLLYQRQIEQLEARACDQYFEGIEVLSMAPDRIPQLDEINGVLKKRTGWGVARVPALISFDRFFKLLANREFPVATFIRVREELDYLQEPDIFHEIFGHCPLLTNQAFADFTETYGRLALSATKEERAYLARLYWMTVEFGLLNTSKGLRIYGGGILSSFGETAYALESSIPVRAPFDILTALRTPYRIDILQPVYYVLEDLKEMTRLCELDLMALVHQAMSMPMLEPLFESDK